MISIKSRTGVLFENDEVNDKLANPAANAEKVTIEKNSKTELVWRNITYFIVMHIGALIGIYLAFTSAKTATNIFTLSLYWSSGVGITAGAHRLWAHRAYKATWQLKLLLIFLQTLSLQGHVLSWARDHRLHHKYSDTMADPYSTARGLFFAHIGWLLRRKYPEVIAKGKGIDMSDLYAERILQFQKEYYWPLMILICYILPNIIPIYCWNESLMETFFITVPLRIVLSLQGTFVVNSIAHSYGYRPYDRRIRPTDSTLISIIAIGEGCHNYHHTFPWDYKTSELGNSIFNPTNTFIHFFARIGWAYDLKTVCPDIIKKRVQRTGDGSHELWGWADEDITKNDEEATIVTYMNNTKHH